MIELRSQKNFKGKLFEKTHHGLILESIAVKSEFSKKERESAMTQFYSLGNCEDVNDVVFFTESNDKFIICYGEKSLNDCNLQNNVVMAII